VYSVHQRVNQITAHAQTPSRRTISSYKHGALNLSESVNRGNTIDLLGEATFLEKSEDDCILTVAMSHFSESRAAAHLKVTPEPHIPYILCLGDP
jgi:hypothetical protein